MTKRILTVTLNPALDKRISVHNFEIGKEFQKVKEIVSAGGKGINVARSLNVLGQKCICIGLLGGCTGSWIQLLLKKEKIEGNFTFTKTATRTNLTIFDEKNMLSSRILEKGLKVEDVDNNKIIYSFKKNIRQCDFITINGSVPAGIKSNLLRNLIDIAHKKHIPTLLDSSGKAFKLALKAAPLIIKPNLQEAQQALGENIKSLRQIKRAINAFHKMGIKIVLLTIGAEGSFGSDGKELWNVKVPKIKIVNYVGCGDAFVAGFLSRFLNHNNFKDCLAYAGAASVANTTNQIPGLISKKNLVELLKRISVKKC